MGWWIILIVLVVAILAYALFGSPWRIDDW